MPASRLIFFCLIIFLGNNSHALDVSDLLPAEKAFSVKAKAAAPNKILLTWEIADGYYLYRDKTKVRSETMSVTLNEPAFPPGQLIRDDFFGDMEVYRNRLELPVTLENPAAENNLNLLLGYQGCADLGVCYPPQKISLTVDLPGPEKPGPMDQLTQGIVSFGQNLFLPELLPADQAFRFSASVVDGQTLHVSWLIAEDYYLYREKIALQLLDANGVELGQFTIPRGKPYKDEAFGQVEIFHDELSFDVPLLRRQAGQQAITLLARYQGCAERGVCYPPMEQTVELQLPEATELTQAPGIVQARPLVSEQQRIASALHRDTLWLTLITFFGFGLLLSFTPCIFPMIPILSGIIIGHGHAVSTARAFLLSLIFVLASAATYTLFGITAALFGSNLQTFFQQPWIILLFSGIFILLSLSMFGFYTLELPKPLQSRLHNASEKHRNGSLVGTAIMGALSALIVGPCVAAPLAGILIFIGQTGDVILGGSALFVLGLGMGVPLLILGASAGKLLPKAGKWLNTTKKIFGVIMLAVAVWMLERILPAPVIMFLWAALLIIPAIYMSALDPLPESSSNWRKLWKGLGLIALIYGTLLLIGMTLGNTNPLQPLKNLALSTSASQHALNFQNISSLQELEQKLQQAEAGKQWVMLDFYADWCISCKQMELYTFTDPEVVGLLSSFVLLQADVTENNAEHQALLNKFGLIGPPGILFFSPDQQEHPELRVIGFQDAETFKHHLNRAKL